MDRLNILRVWESWARALRQRTRLRVREVARRPSVQIALYRDYILRRDANGAAGGQ